MPDIQRWIFTDPHSAETYTVPINPNKMSDPEAKQRDFQFGSRSRSTALAAPDAIRGIENPAQLVEWTFEGVIYHQDHHDALEHWARKPEEVEITDHFGRVWEVVMVAFVPSERRPTPNKPWRFTYEMRATVIERKA
jgi:hypothetical protein